MTTPDEFLRCVLEAVDEAAFRLSHTPRGAQDSWLRGFAERLGAQWLEVFYPTLSANDVDGIVEEVLTRVRARRDELEAAGAGKA